MATRMQQRRGTAQQWTDADPILEAGEIGFETDTGQFKIGDAVNHWSDLSYFKSLEDLSGDFDDYILLTQKGSNGGVATLDSNGHIPVSQLANLIDGSPQNLDTLKEIADAVELVTIHANSTANVHGIANTAALVTDSSLSSTLEGYQDKATIANVVNGYIGTHSDDTTSVHGIADTSLLATKSYADDAANTVQVNLDDHNSETENVHGISNTAALVTLTDTQTLINKTLDTPTIYAGDGVTNVTISAVELSYLDGVTSSIQTQLDAKATPSDISTHNSETANVHGISDTSQLAYLNANTQTFTGSMEIDGNFTVDGNFIVNGSNVLVSATQLQIEDSLLQLAHENAGNSVDLGIVVGYNETGTAKHAGFVRDVSSDKWKLFKGVTTEPATTVDFTEGSLDDLEVNNITAAGVVFTDGTQTKEGVPSRTPITLVDDLVSSSPYTLNSISLRDNLIEVAAASAFTIVIPTNSAVAYPVGTSFDILQTGSGQVTIAGDTGVTVNATPGLKLRTQWSSATLFKRDTNSWVVFGDLMA